MKDPIKLNEWQRILVGEVLTGFFIELFIRAVICYLILVCAMRLMGKRMSSQLSRNELAALVSLAATIGVPLMASDRRVLPALVIALTVVFTQRFIARWAFNDQRFERILQGNVSILIRDGVIDVKEMEKTGLSQERLFAELRCNAVLHLGEVERLYMEANGAFTLMKAKGSSGGLSVLPIQDKIFLQEWSFDHQHKFVDFVEKCFLRKAHPGCNNCGKKEWRAAMKSCFSKVNCFAAYLSSA